MKKLENKQSAVFNDLRLGTLCNIHLGQYIVLICYTKTIQIKKLVLC
jgi:hypothetical protein